MSWFGDLFKSQSKEDQANIASEITGIISEDVAGDESESVPESSEDNEDMEKLDELAAKLEAMEAKLDEATKENKELAESLKKSNELLERYAEDGDSVIEAESEDMANDLVGSGYFAPSAKADVKAFYAALKDIDICNGDEEDAIRVNGKSLTQAFSDLFGNDGPADSARRAGLGASDAEAEDEEGFQLFGQRFGVDTDASEAFTEDEIKEFVNKVAGPRKVRK